MNSLYTAAVCVSRGKPSSGATTDLPSERLNNNATDFNLDYSLSLQQLNRLLVVYKCAVYSAAGTKNLE